MQVIRASNSCHGKLWLLKAGNPRRTFPLRSVFSTFPTDRKFEFKLEIKGNRRYCSHDFFYQRYLLLKFILNCGIHRKKTRRITLESLRDWTVKITRVWFYCSITQWLYRRFKILYKIKNLIRPIFFLCYYFILLGGGATFCRAAISKCSLTMSNKCFTGSVTEWYILCKVHEWIGFFLTPWDRIQYVFAMPIRSLSIFYTWRVLCIWLPTNTPPKYCCLWMLKDWRTSFNCLTKGPANSLSVTLVLLIISSSAFNQCLFNPYHLLYRLSHVFHLLDDNLSLTYAQCCLCHEPLDGTVSAYQCPTW